MGKKTQRRKLNQVKRDREQEASLNRRKYGSWKDVLAEGEWRRCAGCGRRVFVKGDPAGKVCRGCGTPLGKAV